jgi:membrane protein involved in colicin uptake
MLQLREATTLREKCIRLQEVRGLVLAGKLKPSVLGKAGLLGDGGDETITDDQLRRLVEASRQRRMAEDKCNAERAAKAAKKAEADAKREAERKAKAAEKAAADAKRKAERAAAKAAKKAEADAKREERKAKAEKAQADKRPNIADRKRLKKAQHAAVWKSTSTSGEL